ncbi:MAG: DUF1592 domain-containing protein [Verrucomicrobiota bacterium]
MTGASLAAASATDATAAAAVLPAPAPLSTFIDQHCVECHDADVKKGGLDLTALSFDLEKESGLKAWQHVFERVRDGEMPPKKQPQPAKPEAETFLAALKAPLLKADAADIAANGRVRSRRLTRTEYEHTLHDLLGIDIPLKSLLPEDRASHGFETVAEGQQLSYHQLARYLDVADQALAEAFKRALQVEKPFQRHCTPKELAKFTRGNYRGPDFRDGKSLSWPITLQFFGRMKVTEVPEDGWYRVTLHQVQAVNPGPGGVVWGALRSGVCYSNAPLLYMIGLVGATSTPRDMVFEAWIQKDHMLELRPQDATLRRPATGAKGGNVSFEGRDLARDGYAGIAHTGIDLERIHPYANTATLKKRLFGEEGVSGVTPERLPKLVNRFASKAFRRPVTDDQAAPYVAMAEKTLAAGETPFEALRTAYRAILCSPRFLTFTEAPGALDDHAIAARLSYALWVSMPDYQLTTLAAEGRLKDPAVLAAQVERLLTDPKAARFIESFTDQWLKLNQIDFTSPDSRLYRGFDPIVQESMLLETRRYVTEMIQQDLGITHLVDSDFTFLNERLARHYGDGLKLPGVSDLQKTALAPEARRGGLVTQGALLKVTADGTSTSPVVRGVFINERILGNHIPPPPPGIPAIEPDIRGATSIRDQLDKHRHNESCASCHQTIDPPGFALENYDPVGVWRSGYGKEGRGAKVDPSGVTPEGAAFAGLAAWQKIQTQRAEGLGRGFATQFLTYATGAPLRFSQEDSVTQLVRQSQGRTRALIRQSVLSDVFLCK